ncbi:MAG: GNAT family N-acetyltransferase [Bacteroidia bacterium]|jgi:ribosomal-protein-alanine N-acetyltransferase|nr:GNAT family N-acetyltransferase [Bacteroidia bacterium]
MEHKLPTIETARMLLRPVLPKDCYSVYELRSNLELMKYVPRPRCSSLLEARELITDGNNNQTKLNWSATLKGDDTCIGIMGFYRLYLEHFRAEVGYMMLASYHGRGLVTEALQALIAYGFDTLTLHTIEAVTDPDNFTSQHILLKAGFIKEAHFKENLFFDGRFLDSVHYTLHKNNWIAVG